MRNRSITPALSLVCMFLCLSHVQAQLNRSAYGLFGHYTAASHAASFQSLPGIPCCSPTFSDGTGSGLALGLLYQMPVASAWTLSGRLAYASYPGTFSADESTTVNIQGRPVAGIIRHTLDASLASINLEPMIGYRLTNRLTLHGGASVGYVLQRSFTQSETLAEPVQGTLTLPEQVGSGDIPNASSLHAALIAGLSFDIPLFRGSRWFLAPEAFYTVGLTRVADNLNWSANTIRVGVALKYMPPMFALPVPPPEQKSLLLAGIKAVGMQSPDSEPEPIVRITVEEFLSRTHKPLLPYVFFDDASAELPTSYRRLRSTETAAFTPERFNDSTLLAVYYDVLNIIGKRMQDQPGSSITLTGCNSNEGNEKNNIALSQRRAESVKTYLTTVWNIAPSRIEVSGRNLPANPSNVTREEGVAENRRVEIRSNDPSILAPLVTRDTARTATPPIVRFMIEHASEAGIETYSVAASQKRLLLQAFNGVGTPPQYIDWYLQDNPTSLPHSDTSMQYDIRVTDAEAQEYTSPAESINIEQLTIARKRREKLGDKEIVRYTLMSFGYGQADVEADNARYLDDVRRDVSSESTVHITGSTDSIGEESFNQKLSSQRARSVASFLNLRDQHVRGIGEQAFFDNALPEGRFYNRTVHVLIENPVK